MPSGIYQIRNNLNGNRYVGSAVNLDRRWQDHLTRLRRGQHRNAHLQAAFSKYDKGTFVFEVLEHVAPDNLIGREQHYLDMLSPEYNISPTADSSLGVRHTNETKQKISAAMTGKHLSEETRQKIGESNKRRIVSEQTKQKMSEAQTGERNHNYGQHLSEETKRKISEALMGHQVSEKTRAKIGAAQAGGRHHNYGKHPSEETKRKISESLRAHWRKVHIARKRDC